MKRKAKRRRPKKPSSNPPKVRRVVVFGVQRRFKLSNPQNGEYVCGPIKLECGHVWRASCSWEDAGFWRFIGSSPKRTPSHALRDLERILMDIYNMIKSLQSSPHGTYSKSA
jgi:hypothetical protein